MTDIEMIKDPTRWPSYPFLPVKKLNGTPTVYDFGLVHAARPTIVTEANLFRLPATYEQYKALGGKQYESIEALVADGWIVD